MGISANEIQALTKMSTTVECKVASVKLHGLEKDSWPPPPSERLGYFDFISKYLI